MMPGMKRARGIDQIGIIDRLECLDGLRGLLATYVVLGHMAPFAMLPTWALHAVSHGGAAVDMFFILSGLVITQSLLRAGGRARPFLINRMARIFPAFLIVFAVAVAAQPIPCGFEQMPWIDPGSAAHFICGHTWPDDWLARIAAHLTMTHGLFPNGVLPDVWVSFLGAAWSLSTEWQFYALALLIAGRGHVGGQWTLCWVLLALAVGGVCWQEFAPDEWRFSRAFLPNKAHFFALGVASVAVVRGEAAAVGRYAIVLAATLLICATTGAFGKMLPPLAWTGCLGIQLSRRIQGGRGLQINPFTTRLTTTGLTTTGLTTTGLALARNALCARTIQALGAISYSLYLVNEPIHKLTAWTIGRLVNGDGLLFTLLWIPAATGLPIVVAALLYAHVEVPALRWARRHTDADYQRPPQAVFERR